MLDEFFMQIIDMSKIASTVILIIILARLLLKKVPKIVSYALWAVVLFRLLCPLSIEAPVSIIPDDALNGGLGVQHIQTTETNENGNIRYVTSDWWDVWILMPCLW